MLRLKISSGGNLSGCPQTPSKIAPDLEEADSDALLCFFIAPRFCQPPIYLSLLRPSTAASRSASKIRFFPAKIEARRAAFFLSSRQRNRERKESLIKTIKACVRGNSQTFDHFSSNAHLGLPASFSFTFFLQKNFFFHVEASLSDLIEDN